MGPLDERMGPLDERMGSPDALILDYGEVLSRPQRDDVVSAMAAEVRVAPGTFRAAYWEHRLPYDLGLPVAHYWRRVLEALGRAATPPLVERLIAHDVTSWTAFREEVWSIARSFRAGGGRTAVLSNGNPEIMAGVRARRALEPYFDVVVVSYEVGVAKPEARIYEICLDRLGVEAGQALFVDDRAVNVEGAARLGLRTLHFADDTAVERLRALV